MYTDTCREPHPVTKHERKKVQNVRGDKNMLKNVREPHQEPPQIGSE
jgi:hypothetical protein